MINISEIRINCWFKYPNSNPFQIDTDILLTDDFWEDADDNIEPIQLTPEVFERCGFNINDKKDGVITGLYRYKDFKVLHFIQENSFWLLGYGNIEIEYLHQLQNLYFVLTGQEIEIDL